MSSKSPRTKDVFDEWLDEERKTPTQGEITKKQEAILWNELFEKSPFARLFEIKRKKK